MKLFSCFFICVQFLFLDSASAAKFRENDSNNSGILGGNAREKGTLSSSDAMLLSDGNAKGTKHGERDVLLSGHGSINLTLTSTSRELEFEVCNCAGTSSVCYKSLDGWDTKAAGSCSDSTSCELKVHDAIDALKFGETRILKNLFAGCLRTSMKYPNAKVKDTEGNVDIGFESCTPKVFDDGIIELYISIDRSCSIIVKNAKVHVPVIPSNTTLTTKVPPKHSPEHPSESSFPWWGFLIIGIALLIVVAVIGFVLYRLYKNRQTSKRAPQKADESKPRATVSKADIADVETPTKKHDDLEAVNVVPIRKPKKVEAVKVEPIQKSKKVEAVKVEAENVTKEVPPKKVPPKKVQAPVEPTLDDPTTGASITATENQQPHVSVPKNVIHPTPLQPASKAITQYSKSSSRKGSLSGRHEIGMQIMVEKPSETVKRRSPDSIDDATKGKLESDNAIERLTEHGAKFGDNETVVELSAEGERYVQTSSTPEYVRSFAFGGIFRELIDSEAEVNETCPIPLLFVI
uniref:Uncharacterized protein n=1 Tax=Panagrolaimus davidi TaxID=227884 RepID=A0A914Q0J4_9BILA